MGQRSSKKITQNGIPNKKSDTKKSNLTIEKNSKYSTIIEPQKTEKNVSVDKEHEKELPSVNVPAWITEEEFNGILKENIEGFEKIKNFNVKSAVGPGENYATITLRVSMDIELIDKTTKNVSYILKISILPELPDMVEVINIFKKENYVYMNIIPKLEQMYKDRGIDIVFAPKLFKFKNDKLSCAVLLEDLSPLGYKNVDRLQGLNEEQTKSVLKKLAQFHAASAHYAATQGPYHSDLLVSLLGSEDPYTKGMVDNMTGVFLENLKGHKNGEKYYQKVEQISGKLSKQLALLNSSDETEFKVLNHGDCWTNNILFKFDKNGNILDTIFVDFQGPNYASPAQDLLYFIISSVNIELKLTRFEYFIRYYFNELTTHLQILEYPRKMPTLRELHTQIYKNGTWAVVTTIITLAVSLKDATQMSKLENMLNDDENAKEFKNLLYTNKRYREYLEHLLPWMDNRGFFELCDLEPNKVAVTAPKAVPVSEVDKSETINIPPWLTKDLFLDILKANVKNFEDIQTFSIKKATIAGDNYCSVLLSVDINAKLTTGNIEPVSYMLKLPPTGGDSKVLLDMMLTFKKETAMYYEVITEFEKIYRDAGVEVVFGPKSYAFSKKVETDHILLQNLRLQGFKNADRLTGLDVEHTENVLSKLAEFHAASAYYYATKGNYPEVLVKPLLSESTRAYYENITKAGMGQAFVESAKIVPGGALFVDKFENIVNYMFDLMSKAEEINESSFNVMNHGDLWTNNIMFQYDEAGGIANTYFIDFQRSFYGSPTQDLYDFLLTSPSLDIKLKKFDYFIHFYHENLVRNLLLLKYPKEIPTLQQLNIQLMENGYRAVISLVAILCPALLDSNDNANLDNLIANNKEGENPQTAMFTSKRYLKHAETIYPWLHNRGFLDYEYINSKINRK